MRVQDPVCGRSIDVAEVVAAEDDGVWTYFFCSTACHGRFKASRNRYAAERPPHRENTETGAGCGAGG